MRQLRRDLDTSVAAGRQRPLPLQRLRTLLQDERDQQAPRQTEEANGEVNALGTREGHLFTTFAIFLVFYPLCQQFAY